MTLEFNSAQFEKRLSSLKDSQESINSCCHWCLENRQYHKKIVLCWFNVLKRAKVEQRLTLFYLANDVIQYSKRKSYDFVESWVTTLQKATTMVRDEKVKHKILRIFKIWEQRGVYGEEFIADLCGLISTSPKKTDEPSEFQLSYLTQKIKNCSKLETETDHKLKLLKEHNPKIQIDVESLMTSLKDRAHVDDVEKELEDYTKHMETYVTALKAEIKARSHLISLLLQAQTQLETERKDVKVVANAYKTFGTRVKNVKKKLDDVLPSLPSPVPSPDINAPSPSPDSDIELSLPGNNPVPQNDSIVFHNAGYYNPASITSSDDRTNIQNNNFSSFMGANNPFNLQNFNPASLFSKVQEDSSMNLNSQKSSNVFTAPKPVAPPNSNYYNNSSTQMSVLQPPPMPPFSKHEEMYNSSSAFDTSSYNNSSIYSNSDLGYQMSSIQSHSAPTPSYDQHSFSQQNNTFQSSSNNSYNSAYDVHNVTNYSSYDSQNFINTADKNFHNSKVSYDIQNRNLFSNSSNVGEFDNPANIPMAQISPFTQNEEYNPEEEPETWDSEGNWDQLQSSNELETPESPPLYEKESYNDPVEYHDRPTVQSEDVDHRVLTLIPSLAKEMKSSHRGKDVDHRNLISLTGSPGDSSSSQTVDSSLWNKKDQDYRKTKSDRFEVTSGGRDQDYRAQFNIENLKLPPPPPPPVKTKKKKIVDNDESIDMEMSDDDLQVSTSKGVVESSSNDVNFNSNEHQLLPPPPFPDLTDDIDANNFLDSLNNDIMSGEFERERTASNEKSSSSATNCDLSAVDNNRTNRVGAPPPFGVYNAEQNRWNVPLMSIPPAAFANVNVNDTMGGLLPTPPNGWNGQEFCSVDGFRGGRGVRMKNNFVSRGGRGNWNGNNCTSSSNSSDVNGGRNWSPNGHFSRGGIGRSAPRGNFRGGFSRGNRTRGGFRGNYRGNFQ